MVFLSLRAQVVRDAAAPHSAGAGTPGHTGRAQQGLMALPGGHFICALSLHWALATEQTARRRGWGEHHRKRVHVGLRLLE